MAAAPGSNPLTTKYGPLVGWQWVAVVGGAFAAFYFIRARNASSTSSSTVDPTTGVPYSQELAAGAGGLGGGALDGIVGQQGPPGARGAPGPRGPRGPAGKVPKPPKKPPKRDTTRPAAPKAADVAAGEAFGAAVLKGQAPWPKGVPVPKGITLNPTTRKVVQK